MTKLTVISRCIFYLLTSIFMLFFIIINNQGSIFLTIFDVYDLSDRIIILHLIFASIFIIFTVGLSIFELYRLIKKRKAFTTFGLFTGALSGLLIYECIVLFLHRQDAFGIILFMLLAIFVYLPYVIKLFDKKDLITLPRTLYIASDVTIFLTILFLTIMTCNSASTYWDDTSNNSLFALNIFSFAYSIFTTCYAFAYTGLRFFTAYNDEF